MAKYRLRIKQSAQRELEAIATRADRQRVVSRIMQLADNPRPPGTSKLSGFERYRVRQGRYRILYAVEDSALLVHVIKIGGRKDVYRSMTN